MIRRWLPPLLVFLVIATGARGQEQQPTPEAHRYPAFSGIIFPPPLPSPETREPRPETLRQNAFLSWRPAPTFGPGSLETGDLSLATFRGKRTLWQLRLALEEFTRDPQELLQEAQEETNYPLFLGNAKPASDEEADFFSLSAWTAELFHWYRFLYFVLSFD